MSKRNITLLPRAAVRQRKFPVYVGIWLLVAINLWLYLRKKPIDAIPNLTPEIPPEDSLDEIPNLASAFSSEGFAHHDRHVRKKIHYSKYKFSYSEEFETKAGGWKAFSRRSRARRCLAFFRFLDEKEPEWKFDYYKEMKYHKPMDEKENFVKNKIKDFEKHKKSGYQEISDDEKERINRSFDEVVNATMAFHQKTADAMTIIRIFGNCFLAGDSLPTSGKLHEIFQRYSRRIVPFFHPKVPLSKSQDIYTNTEWGFDKHGQVPNGNLLEYYYKNKKGTGMVFSVGNSQVADLVRLIHLLRVLGNELPIEVFHRSDLSEKNKDALMNAASASKDELLSEKMTNVENLKQALLRAEISESEVTKLPLPIQKLTIVDIRRPLSALGKEDFSGYYNKLLAYFFTSFETVLLLDADTVPLIPPKKFLSLKEFKNTGALFFKDRNLPWVRGWMDTNNFARLMPHKTNLLDVAMGIKPVTKKTMENTLMSGWYHLQEAGVVILDRKRHFHTLLTLLPLALWKEPVKPSTWGEKEMFWLSMSMAGDEEYTFDKHGSLSIGELELETKFKIFPDSQANQLCSSHIGHLSDKGELLWVNGGLFFCKRNSLDKDSEMFPYSQFTNKNIVTELYNSPFRIRHAIIPPEYPSLRSKDGEPSEKDEEIGKEMRRRWDVVETTSRVSQFSNTDPLVSWCKRGTCGNIEYCAFDQVNSTYAPEGISQTTAPGRVIEFDASRCRRYDLLAAIWFTSRVVS